MTTETGANPLECSHVEKDLGILVDDQLKFTQQVQQAVSKTNRLLGVIRRTYQYLDRTTFLHLYKGLVRPTLEYGVVVWSPQYQHDIDALEAVQRRATRMVPVLRHLDYESRLKAFNLPTLILLMCINTCMAFLPFHTICLTKTCTKAHGVIL